MRFSVRLGAKTHVDFSSQPSFSTAASELTRRLVARGIRTSGWTYHRAQFGCWQFLARKGGQQCEVFWDARDYLFEIRRSAQGELKLDAVYPDATSADIIGFTEARLTEWFDSINEKISTKQEGGPGACFPFVSRSAESPNHVRSRFASLRCRVRLGETAVRRSAPQLTDDPVRGQDR